MILAVFRSRLVPGHDGEYAALVDRMESIARSLPGFISEKTFQAADGERVSVQEWASADALKVWREHPEHLEAQRLGREKYYASYSLFVTEEMREKHFERS